MGTRKGRKGKLRKGKGSAWVLDTEGKRICMGTRKGRKGICIGTRKGRKGKGRDLHEH